MNTEIIYAQILQAELVSGKAINSHIANVAGSVGDELGIPVVNVTRFNPLAVRRQPFLDFLRLQPHDRIVIIGSAELHTQQFPVYLKKSHTWMLVPREKLGDLVDTQLHDPQ